MSITHVLVFLKSLPEWKAVIAAIIFFVGLPLMVRRLLYGWIIDRREESRSRELADVRQGNLGTSILIDSEMLIAPSKPLAIPLAVWSWFAKRAYRWENRKRRRG